MTAADDGTAKPAEGSTPEDNLAELVRRQLASDPYFHSRLSLLTIKQLGDTVIVSGSLPTFYLKQVLQEAVRRTPGVAHVENLTIVESI